MQMEGKSSQERAQEAENGQHCLSFAIGVGQKCQYINGDC